MAQCQTLPASFTSSLRGDITACRFELPKANVAYNANGFTTIGLGDKTTRKVISHDFEQQKARENRVSLDRIEGRPQGQRFAAAHEWLEQQQQQRNIMEQEAEQKQVQHEIDSLRGILHQLPEYATSLENPLLTRPQTAPAASGATSSPIADSLTANSISRPQSPETYARVYHARNLDGNLAVGSLEPVGDPEQEAEEGRQQSALAALMAEHEQRLLLAEQLAEQMVKLYPHGVPKRIQLELARQGVDLPGLGFGCSHAVPTRDTAFTSNR